MLRSTKRICLGTLGLGLLLGYLAATGTFGTRPAVFADQKTAPAADRASPDKLDRTVLPVPEPRRPPITEIDARKAKAPPRFDVTAPKGAPNVVIVLIDDMRFGQCSAFGGPIHMPTCERLAANGLKYNRFHYAEFRFMPTEARLLGSLVSVVSLLV